MQSWLMPLVVSWGYESDAPSGSRFIDYHEWQGTRDIAAYLATPAAIEFQAEHDWPTVRAECHALAQEARERLNAITGLEPICPDAPEWFGQMATIRLPAVDGDALKIQLYERYRIEVPVSRWNDEPIVRVSCQAYNSLADVEVLARALEELL